MSDGIDAGELDRRISILRASKSDDGFSSDVRDFAPVDKRWAKKTDVSDGERVAASAQGQALTTRFLVRWDSLTTTITGADRIDCEKETHLR